MAQQTTVRLVDDINGADAVETVNFGIDGKSYEIDLSEDNATRLRDALAEFVNAARRPNPRVRPAGFVSSAGTSRGAKAAITAQKREHLDRVRAWAREQGLPVKDRGRISHEIEAQYLIAQGRSGVAAPEFASVS